MFRAKSERQHWCLEKIIEPVLLAAIVTCRTVYPRLIKFTSAVFGLSYVYGIPVLHAAVVYSSHHVSSGCGQWHLYPMVATWDG